MSKLDQLRALVSHDGLRDSLTGLMSFSSFTESAVRELVSAQRFERKLNLFLIALTEPDLQGIPSLVIRPGHEAGDLNEEELYELAARVLRMAKLLSSELRSNDLIARYALTEFLIMNFGDKVEITNKLSIIAENCGASLVSAEIGASQGTMTSTSPNHFQDELRKAIASLESELLATFRK